MMATTVKDLVLVTAGAGSTDPAMEVRHLSADVDHILILGRDQAKQDALWGEHDEGRVTAHVIDQSPSRTAECADDGVAHIPRALATALLGFGQPEVSALGTDHSERPLGFSLSRDDLERAGRRGAWHRIPLDARSSAHELSLKICEPTQPSHGYISHIIERWDARCVEVTLVKPHASRRELESAALPPEGAS